MDSMLSENFNLYLLVSDHLHGRDNSATSGLFSCAWLICTSLDCSVSNAISLWFSEAFKAKYHSGPLFSNQSKNSLIKFNLLV